MACEVKNVPVADHGELYGLTDDDHTQYALLAGRATGQTLIGGTASGDDLTLRSTSNATKGDIILADQGGNVLIGGGATASELRLFEPSGSGSNYTSFKSPALGSNVNYTLPIDDGSSSQVLTTDGSGVLSWTTPAAGVSIGGTVTSGTTGSVLFVGPGPVLAQDNANFFFDDTNNRLGLGITSPANRLHIDAGTGNASALQFSANATTGQSSSDGFHLGIASDGSGIINQKEALDIVLSNNNLATITFTSDNRAYMGTDLFNATLSVSPNLDLTGIGSLTVNTILLPTINYDDDGNEYYCLGVLPLIQGSGGPSIVCGAFFAVVSNSDGNGQTLTGLLLSTQYSGGGTQDFVYGATADVLANDDTVNDEIVSLKIGEPQYNEKEKCLGLQVNGTWGVSETADSSTNGTVNAFLAESSYYYFTHASGVTLNGISGGKSGKRILFRFKSGATITHNSGSAATGDKIFTSTAANITITGSGSIEVVWSADDNGWNVISQQL